MLEQANVLCFEDPTNHLDLESISALNDGMINYKGNILFSSHDAELLNTVANRLIVIEDGKKVFDKETTYEEYMEEKSE
jgi:ATPase subunit of ABC transporter with duplicated ATPase domains